MYLFTLALLHLLIFEGDFLNVGVSVKMEKIVTHPRGRAAEQRIVGNGIPGTEKI